ncbi:hypothetical protein [Arthrobacter celericrescens]|uniref:hypothetical protein n=1 Tax=Arthrobacter celericrescens TaxID=2320851 RepID=UPI000EA1ABF1|nr:hypothetical protein [Arthrobacter celericrescens]
MTRVRVTAPQSAGRRPAGLLPSGSVSRDAAVDSDVGRLYVRSLIRSQLRLAIAVAAGFLLVLAACGLMVALVPEIAVLRLLGVPLNWLLLGAGLYPVIGLAAWLYNRSAARNEARYRELVDER